MVEAMGVEPMSAIRQIPSATCLAFEYIYLILKDKEFEANQLSDTVQATQLKNLA